MLVDGKIYMSHSRRQCLVAGVGRTAKVHLRGDPRKARGCIWMEKTPGAGSSPPQMDFCVTRDGDISEFAPEASEFIRKNDLLSACRLPHGDLCLGTLNGGIAVVGPAGELKQVITPWRTDCCRAAYIPFSWHRTARSGPLRQTASRASRWTEATSLFRREAGFDWQDPATARPGRIPDPRGHPGRRIRPAHRRCWQGALCRTARSDRPLHDLEPGADEHGLRRGLQAGRSDRWGPQSKQIFSTKTGRVPLPPVLVPAPESFLLADGFDIERLSPSAGGGIETKYLLTCRTCRRHWPRTRGGNIWVGTVSRGAFLVPRGTDNPAPPISLAPTNENPTWARVGRTRQRCDSRLHHHGGSRMYLASVEDAAPARCHP